VSPLPERMADHWWWRPGCRPGRRQYVWHILFADHAGVRRIVRDLQARIAELPGLDLVPEPWLHMTTHIVGFTDEITEIEAKEIAAAAAVRLRDINPVKVTFGRTLFHPEAVMLAAGPGPSLMPLRVAVSGAAAHILGPERAGSMEEWIPHVTTAYSNADGPAQRVIHAAGRSPGDCAVTIADVHLVAQEREGHLYRWEPVATVRLRGGALP
jgi:2'-5' RNA ligase